MENIYFIEVQIKFYGISEAEEIISGLEEKSLNRCSNEETHQVYAEIFRRKMYKNHKVIGVSNALMDLAK